MNLKSQTLIVTLFAIVAGSQAQMEGFDNVGNLFSGGTWAQANLSNPVGASGTSPWVQGDPATFGAYAGATNSYIAANFESTGDTGTISAWLFSPTRTYYNGDKVSFFTRTQTESLFPDRLQVRWSGNGSSVNVGSTESSVGDFSTLMLEINPNQTALGYPDGWTSYSVTMSGLSGGTSGRLAFRYYVTDAGAQGDNGNIVAIDNFQAVPEPGSLAALALGAAFVARRRRQG